MRYISVTFIAVLLTVSSLGAPAGAADDPVLTVDDILAKWRAASGADVSVPSQIEVWKYSAHGLSGTIRRLRLGKDSRETVQLGSSTTASGVNGGAQWRQNANGQVLMKQDEPPDADVKIVSRSVTRVSDPVDAYVITSVAANGATTRSYYDPRSFLLTRRERKASGVESYTIYQDFGTDSAGRTVAHHISGGDRRPGSAWDSVLLRDDLSTPLSAVDVAIPPNSRTLVEFPQGTTKVRLPARIVNGAIVVRVGIGDRGVDFGLDSGSSAIFLDTAVAAQLGLRLEGNSTLTVAGDVPASSVRIPQMRIGELTLRDVAVTTLPFRQNVDDQTNIAGLLGFDFFDGAVLSVDYQKGTVDATAPAAYRPAADQSLLPVRLNDGVPETALTIGTSRGDSFIVDTGAQGATLVLFQHFARLNARSIDPVAERGEGIRTASPMIGGIVGATLVTLNEISLGTFTIPGARAVLARSPPAFDSKDGLIGSGLLQLFQVTFDEPHSMLYLHPVALDPDSQPAK